MRYRMLQHVLERADIVPFGYRMILQYWRSGLIGGPPICAEMEETTTLLLTDTICQLQAEAENVSRQVG